MFSTETSSSNAIRSVVPSADIDDVRQRIETHQHYLSTIDIVEGSNGSVVCALGKPVEPNIENAFISGEANVAVEFSNKTTVSTGPVKEVVFNPVCSINDSETVDVDKYQSSVSLKKPIKRHLLETHL